MKKIAWLVFFLSAVTVHAEDAAPLRTGLFTNAKEVFAPLLADPREVQLALRLVLPVGRTAQGEVILGSYFGLYRWALPGENSYVQWSIGGAAFPRFDLVTTRKDFEIVDYIASMPIDLRKGAWSMRLLPYHISSHLGDDYILKTGQLPNKYSFDSFKQLLAYDRSGWRLYGGYNYVIRSEYTDLGRWATQEGLEWRSGWWAGGHAQTFWANDFQSWQRVKWNPAFNSQLGVKMAQHPAGGEALSLYLEYGTGHRPFGQFFQQQESHWVLGLRFDL